MSLAPLGDDNSGAPDFFNPTELVTFVIGKGPSAKTFIIHKEVACLYSPVLKAAFNSDFIEGQTQKYKLEDTSETAFRHLMQWMYSQRIKFKVHTEEINKPLVDQEAHIKHYNVCVVEFASLCELWVLADKLLIPNIQNQIMDHLDRVCKTCDSNVAMHADFIYENTQPKSPLRAFAIYKLVRMFERRSSALFTPLLPDEVLIDVIAEGQNSFSAQKIGTFPPKGESKDFYVPRNSE